MSRPSRLPSLGREQSLRLSCSRLDDVLSRVEDVVDAGDVPRESNAQRINAGMKSGVVCEMHARLSYSDTVRTGRMRIYLSFSVQRRSQFI